MTLHITLKKRMHYSGRDQNNSGEEYRYVASQNMSGLKENLLKELEFAEYNALSDIIENIPTENLSFKHIFGDKKRIRIPFAPGSSKEIVVLVEFFESRGYQINWQEGTVSKTINTQAGPREKKARIGKVITKYISIERKFAAAWRKWQATKIAKKTARKNFYNALGFLRLDPSFAELYRSFPKAVEKYPEVYKKYAKDAFETEKAALKDVQKISGLKAKEFDLRDTSVRELEDALKFWNERSEFYKNNPEAVSGGSDEYSLIITRAPIDVLRMSDYETIQSCHSPPSRGSELSAYFMCAVEEARGHGPIVYVVANKDIPEDMDLEADEVFKDLSRNVPGMEPKARLRIRKFVDDTSGAELAIPEIRTYGQRFPNLVNAVTKFLKSYNPSLEDVDPDELVRYGGSHEDTTDEELLQLFYETDTPFDTQQYSDEEPFGSNTGLIEWTEKECARLQALHREELKDVSDYSFMVKEDEQHYDRVKINVWGTNYYDISHPKLRKEEFHDNEEQINRDFKNRIDKFLSMNFAPNTMSYSLLRFRESITFSYGFRRVVSTPEEFQDFLTDEVKKLQEGRKQIENLAKLTLAEYKVLELDDLSHFRAVASTTDDTGIFKHFDVNYEEDDESVLVDTKHDSWIKIDITELIRYLAAKDGVVPKEVHDLKEYVEYAFKIANSYEFLDKVFKTMHKVFNQATDEPVELEELEVDGVPAYNKRLITLEKQVLLFDFSFLLDKYHDADGVEERDKITTRMLKAVKRIDQNFDQVSKIVQDLYYSFVKTDLSISENYKNKDLTFILEVDKYIRCIERQFREDESYQKMTKTKHPKWKKLTIEMGDNKSIGGGHFT